MNRSNAVATCTSLDDMGVERFDDDSIVLTGCGWVTPLAQGNIRDVLGVAGSTPPSIGDAPCWLVPDAFCEEQSGLSKEIQSDKGAWLAALALVHACRDASLDLGACDPNRIGIALGCALAGQLGMIDFANEVRDQSARFVSPLHFPPDGGQLYRRALSRAYGVRGPNLTIACGAASGLDAIAEAAGLLRDDRADVVLAGGVNALTESLARVITPSDAPPSEGACVFVLERAADARRRDATVLAMIAETTRDDGLPPIPPAATGRIVSSVGTYDKSAIAIERWVGRCLGALGSAAVAAAIGAATGSPVPLDGSSGSKGASPSVDGETVDAVVFARHDLPTDASACTHRTVMRLTVPAAR